MMSKLAVFCLLFAGCAAGGAGAGVDRETKPHAAPVAMVAMSDTAGFPTARNPRLPSADRIARQIRTELGEVASADVRLCVAPDGRVQTVQIVRGTSLGDFNDALVRDVSDWQFSATNLRACEVTTISYRLHP
jgi:hypothetical protein